MRIPSHLMPSLLTTSSLLLVASRQGARFYIVENGSLDEVDSFALKKPAYSDREGFFEVAISGPPGTIRSGAVYEEKEEQVAKEFRHRLAQHLSAITLSYAIEKAFLFCPEHLKSSVMAALPKSVRNKIIMTFFGNFSKSHPSLLLEKIRSEKSSKKVSVRSEEADALSKRGKS